MKLQEFRKLIREEIEKTLKENDQFENAIEIGRKNLTIDNRLIFNLIAILVPRKTGFTPYIITSKEAGLAPGQSGFAPFGTSQTVKTILWKGTPADELSATKALEKAMTSISIK